jgi:hypothetical protein
MKLLHIRKSTRNGKKLVATFDDGRSVHFGARNYGDYIYYSSINPSLAKKKRVQYIARHGATESWKDPATPATLSRFILWEHPTLRGSVVAYKKRFRV